MVSPPLVKELPVPEILMVPAELDIGKSVVLAVVPMELLNDRA
jgi:hypothetical protein